MTTTTETKATAKATSPSAPKKRKPLVKRGFTEVGKFFAKVRIDLGLTTDQWAKKLEVSGNFINNVERGDKAFDLDFVRKAQAVLLPEHQAEFANIVADVLGVLVIPAEASDAQIQNAYASLHFPIPALGNPTHDPEAPASK